MSLQIFYRLFSLNFAWSILEYFLPNMLLQKRHGAKKRIQVKLVRTKNFDICFYLNQSIIFTILLCDKYHCVHAIDLLITENRNMFFFFDWRGLLYLLYHGWRKSLDCDSLMVTFEEKKICRMIFCYLWKPIHVLEVKNTVLYFHLEIEYSSSRLKY